MKWIYRTTQRQVVPARMRGSKLRRTAQVTSGGVANGSCLHLIQVSLSRTRQQCHKQRGQL